MSSAPPRWAAPLAAAVACSAFALWNPPLRDLAAHTFRAEFFEDHGFAIWNNSWYGGHYLLSYSVLFPPLAALLSPVWAAAGAAVATRMAVRSHRARALGRAGGVGAACGSACSARSRCSRTGGWCSRSAPPSRSARCGPCRQAGAASRSCWRSACALASPVAAAFLALVCVVGALYSRAPRRPARDRRPRRWCRSPCWGCCSPRAGSSRSGSRRGGRWRCSARSRCSPPAGTRPTATCAPRPPRTWSLATLAAAVAEPAGRQHDTARLAVRRAAPAGDRAHAGARGA